MTSTASPAAARDLIDRRRLSSMLSWTAAVISEQPSNASAVAALDTIADETGRLYDRIAELEAQLAAR